MLTEDDYRPRCCAMNTITFLEPGVDKTILALSIADPKENHLPLDAPYFLHMGYAHPKLITGPKTFHIQRISSLLGLKDSCHSRR